MADTFQLQGAMTTAPATGVVSGSVQVVAQLDDTYSAQYKYLNDIHLTSDAEFIVDFGGSIANVGILYLRAVGGKVRARITSADGTSQAVPVDPQMLLFAQSVPITALGLTRVPSTDTVLTVFLAQLA